MVEDTFLYCLTLFIFTVIFLLCYIRYKFTYFERCIKSISNTNKTTIIPTFPFGNVSDVIFGYNPLFVQLWKFYNKFKKRNCKYGGFYIFLQPAIILIDKELIKQIKKNDTIKYENTVDKESREKSIKLFLEPLKNSLTQLRPGDNNFSDVCQQFISAILQISCDDFNKLHHQNHHCFANFKNLFGIAYSSSKSLKNQELINLNKLEETDKLVLIENLKTACDLIQLALFELSCNSEVQDELRGEVTRFKKYKTWTDLDQLPYLVSVIKETLRKYPPRPFEIVKFKLEKFPDEMITFISIFGLHYSPEIYFNPKEFDPDRFSEENEKMIDPNCYLPFGTNPDSGYIIEIIMKLALIEFLPKFKVGPSKKFKRPLQFNEQFLGLSLKEPIWLKLDYVNTN